MLAPSAEQWSSLDAGQLPPLAVHDGGGERIASAPGEPDLTSQLMLQALELENKVLEGEGSVRQLASGHVFTLTQHARYADDNRFTVLWVRHEARNNFKSKIRSAAPIAAAASNCAPTPGP